MTNVSRTEIAPEQKLTLDALKTSIEQDADTNVQAEGANLQQAVDRNDRTHVMSALRVLEERLETLEAVDRHREKLNEAKYAVGYTTDDIDTAMSRGLETAKETVIDPLTTIIAEKVPGAADAMEAIRPTTESLKESFAKLPTALRLPVLGTVMAGTGWLASFPVKWMGKLVGLVSEKGQAALEKTAKAMRTTGKIAFLGSLGLGAASALGNLHRKGTFDPTLESMKGKPSPTPDTAPDAAPSSMTHSFEELKNGIIIDGKNVQLLSGPAVSVNGVRWNIQLPVGIGFSSAEMHDGALTVRGTVGGFIPGSKTFSPETTRKMVESLASATENEVPVINDNGEEIGGSFERA